MMSAYKWCFIPKCTNTSSKNPNKVFFTVPKAEKQRKKWFKAARRDFNVSLKSCLYCCEDHFNVQQNILPKSMPNNLANNEIIQFAMACPVEGCYSTTRKGIKSFCFPTNPVLCKKWIEFTGSRALLEYWEKRRLKSNSMNSVQMCIRHFRPEDIIVMGDDFKRKRNVIPSLNGPSNMAYETKPKTPISSCSTHPLHSLTDVNPSVFTTCDSDMNANLVEPQFPIRASKSPDSFSNNEAQTNSVSNAIVPLSVESNIFSKRVCLVEGCYSTNKTKGVRLFCFPTNNEVCLKWIEFTGSQKLIYTFSSYLRMGLSVPMSSRICSRHFCYKDYETDWRINLIDVAVPSLNGPTKIKVEVKTETIDD